MATITKADHTRLHKLKRDARRERLIAAYEDYANKVPSSQSRLLNEVRDFAHTKIMHLEPTLAKVLAVIPVFAWNYFGRRTMVFEGAPPTGMNGLAKVTLNWSCPTIIR